jgi:hypothetical protein
MMSRVSHASKPLRASAYRQREDRDRTSGYHVLLRRFHLRAGRGLDVFFLIVALTAVLVPGPAVRANFNYRVEITGAEDRDLTDLLDKVSELKTLADKPPASEEALRQRADQISAGSPMPHTLRLGSLNCRYKFSSGMERESRSTVH